MNKSVSQPQAPGNSRTAIVLLALVVGMLGLAYAAVPLYQIFCQATGYGGTTRRAEGNPKGIVDRQMGVRFDASIGGGVPLRVVAAEEVTDKIGAVRTVVFKATNLSQRAITTTAGYNVVPELAGSYFNKIQCFCFTEQVFKPGETVDMPVTFFVDPDIAQNSDLETLREITLSYTFYLAEKGSS